jgi:hypothetical protein
MGYLNFGLFTSKPLFNCHLGYTMIRSFGHHRYLVPLPIRCPQHRLNRRVLGREWWVRIRWGIYALARKLPYAGGHLSLGIITLL